MLSSSSKSQQGAPRVCLQLQPPVEARFLSTNLGHIAIFLSPASVRGITKSSTLRFHLTTEAKELISAGETWWNYHTFSKLSNICFPERRISSRQHNPAESAEACWRGFNWRYFLPTTSPPRGWNIILDNIR